jgi:hypothetical protein
MVAIALSWAVRWRCSRRHSCRTASASSYGGRRRWWTFRPGPGWCAESAGPRFPSVPAKTGPITGVDVVRIEPWPPPAIPSGIAVCAGPPRGPVCVPATPSGIDRVAAEGVAGAGRWPVHPGRTVPGRGLSGAYVGRGRLGFAPSVGKDHPEAPERQLVSGSPGCPPGSRRPIAGPPAGTRPATAPASREPFAGVRDAESCAREPDAYATHGRYQPVASRWMPAHASLGTTVSVSPRRAGSAEADMP